MPLSNLPTEQPSPAKPASALKALISLLILGGIVWYFVGGGIEGSVAHDMIDQYNIAKRSGTRMDVCVHAGAVSAAFLQAKDEDQYKVWKAQESTDCAAAGLPIAP